MTQITETGGTQSAGSPTKKTSRDSSNSKNDSPDNIQLENLGPVRNLVSESEFTRNGKTTTQSVLTAIVWIQDAMWAPVPEPGHGLSNKTMAATVQYRDGLPPVVTVNQLQALFGEKSSLIDRQVVTLCRSGTLRRLVVNQIEGGDLLIGAEQYYSLCRAAAYTKTLQVHQLENGREKGEYVDVMCSETAVSVLSRFASMCRQRPSAPSVSQSDLVEFNLSLSSDLNFLLSKGFLTLIPGASHEYAISVPNIGSFLRLVAGARKWVKTVLRKLPWSEGLESELDKKWNNAKAHWTEFRGCRLEWVLFDLAGGGYCEPFSTPVGRGWKLTGK